MIIDSTELGAMLKLARQEAGMSVEKVSELCNVHRNTICNWEKDARSMPYLSVINYCFILIKHGKNDTIGERLNTLMKRICLTQLFDY